MTRENKKAYDRARYLAKCEEMKAYGDAYYLAHREERILYRKIYQNAHIEEQRKHNKAYQLAHPGRIKASQKKWWGSLRGKEAHKRYNAKRKQFGFIPLNEYFLGSEGHHTNYNYVIYIPKKLHRSIWHSIISGVGMKKINNEAFKFLRNQTKK